MSNSVINFGLVNLLTGAIVTQSVALGVALGPLLTYGIGGTSAGSNGGSSISSAMISLTYLPMTRVLEWAADPWSFWYP